ncbi:MAG: hypothetical protein ABWY29_00620 [Blastococcus sp.]
MEIDPVGGVSSVARRPLQPMGVSAQLADSRRKLREATPPDRWDAVQAEVHRLQLEQGMPPLAALQAVYARLAAGWIPPLPR